MGLKAQSRARVKLPLRSLCWQLINSSRNTLMLLKKVWTIFFGSNFGTRSEIGQTSFWIDHMTSHLLFFGHTLWLKMIGSRISNLQSWKLKTYNDATKSCKYNPQRIKEMHFNIYAKTNNHFRHNLSDNMTRGQNSVVSIIWIESKWLIVQLLHRTNRIVWIAVLNLSGPQLVLRE